MTIFYALAYYLFRVYFFCFHRHKVYGLENLPAGPVIIASNHASFYDPPLLTASCPEEVAFLARTSLFRNRFFRFLITHLNAYPIGEGNQDMAAFKLVGKLLKEGKKVVIFPEGVRTPNGQLSEIKTGVAMLAMRNKCPIVPVYIHGTYESWSRYSRFPSLWGRTACVFGKPIAWEKYAALEKKEALEKITNQLAVSIQELRHWYEAGAQGPMPV